jgi:hypothetical protein
VAGEPGGGGPLLDQLAEFKAEIINEDKMDIEGDHKPLRDLLTEEEVGLGNMLADTTLSNFRDEVKEEVRSRPPPAAHSPRPSQ